MKAAVLLAFFLPTLTSASAQSLLDRLPTGEVRPVIEDRTEHLDPVDLDTLTTRLEHALGWQGVSAADGDALELRFIIERHEREGDWYRVSLWTELSERVRRLREPQLEGEAITWRTHTGNVFSARRYTPLEGTWNVLREVLTAPRK